MTNKEILEYLCIPYKAGGLHKKVTQGFYGFSCPFCHSTEPLCAIPKNGRGCSCWRCGKLNMAWTLTQASSKPYNEVKALLGDLRHDHSETTHRSSKGVLTLPDGLQSLTDAHREYLVDRKFDPDYLESVWGLKSIRNDDWRTNDRIFIPYTVNEEIVSWTARTTKKDNPVRYWSASSEQEKMSHKSILGGQDYCGNTVVVCEGPFDAFRIGPGAVWLSGVGYTHSQLHKISKYPMRLINFDSSDCAQKLAKQLANELALFPGETYNVVMSGKDPDESPEHEIEELRRYL